MTGAPAMVRNWSVTINTSMKRGWKLWNVNALPILSSQTVTINTSMKRGWKPIAGLVEVEDGAGFDLLQSIPQ